MNEPEPKKVNGAMDEEVEVTLSVGVDKKAGKVALIVEFGVEGSRRRLMLRYDPKEAVRLGGLLYKTAGEAHVHAQGGKIVRPKLRFPRR